MFETSNRCFRKLSRWDRDVNFAPRKPLKTVRFLVLGVWRGDHTSEILWNSDRYPLSSGFHYIHTEFKKKEEGPFSSFAENSWSYLVKKWIIMAWIQLNFIRVFTDFSCISTASGFEIKLVPRSQDVRAIHSIGWNFATTFLIFSSEHGILFDLLTHVVWQSFRSSGSSTAGAPGSASTLPTGMLPATSRTRERASRACEWAPKPRNRAGQSRGGLFKKGRKRRGSKKRTSPGGRNSTINKTISALDQLSISCWTIC